MNNKKRSVNGYTWADEAPGRGWEWGLLLMFCLLCEHFVPGKHYDLCAFLYELYIIKSFTLKKKTRVGEAAQQLRMTACYSRDLDLVPSACEGWLTTAWG